MTILKFVIVFNPLPASTCHLCALYIPRYPEFQHGTARILTRNLYAIIFFSSVDMSDLYPKETPCVSTLVKFPRKRALNLSICGYWSLEVRLYSLTLFYRPIAVPLCLLKCINILLQYKTVKTKVDAQWIEITKFTRNLTGSCCANSHRIGLENNR